MRVLRWSEWLFDRWHRPTPPAKEPILKQIVCLANSRKYQGRCIAGKERLFDGRLAWVRPVSARPNEEISDTERRYSNGSEPALLDMIDVPVQHPVPHSYQSENWLLDPQHRWVQRRRAEWRHLAALADDPATLWVNESSSVNGRNDRIAATVAAELPCSLYLLRLSDVALHISSHVGDRGVRRRLHASFTWHDIAYRLAVTDPAIETIYLTRKDGVYRIGRAYATISLGEPFRDGFCYKLVAALILPPSEAP
jgi:hypothetical protein